MSVPMFIPAVSYNGPYSLPGDGASGQVLSTDGSHGLRFIDIPAPDLSQYVKVDGSRAMTGTLTIDLSSGAAGVGLKIVGVSQDGSADHSNGAVIALGHNSAFNRQIGFCDSVTGIGIRMLGSGLDSFNYLTGARNDLVLGNDSTHTTLDGDYLNFNIAGTTKVRIDASGNIASPANNDLTFATGSAGTQVRLLSGGGMNVSVPVGIGGAKSSIAPMIIYPDSGNNNALIIGNPATGQFGRIRLIGNLGAGVIERDISGNNDQPIYFGETSDTGNYEFRGSGAVRTSKIDTASGNLTIAPAGGSVNAPNIVANNKTANGGNLVTIGSATGSESYPGIWFGSASPTLSNFAFLADVGASQSIVNAPVGGSIPLRINNSTIVHVSNAGVLFPIDNTYDMGASGAAPRDIWAARNIHVPGGILYVGDSGMYIGSSNQVRLLPAGPDGVLRMQNAGGTGFSMLQLGGYTSSFPALKVNGSGLDLRNGDDTAFTAFSCGPLISTGPSGGLRFNDRNGVGGHNFEWYTDGNQAYLYSYQSSANVLGVNPTGTLQLATLLASTAMAVGGVYNTGNGKVNIIGFGAPGSGTHNLWLSHTDATSSDGLHLGTSGSGAYKFLQSFNGHLALNPLGNNVGIGTSTPSHKLDVNGSIALNGNSAPADAALSASQVSLWFDNTNGAAKLMVKGKSANGTVVTGSVTLS